MYQAKNISYSIDRMKILNQVSVAVFPGKFTAIVGPNGAGKSTLLKALCRDIIPNEGEITINNQAISTYTSKELALTRAVLPQKTHLSLAFTAEEVVMLGRTPHSTSNQQNKAIAHEVMREADVYHLKARVYQTLSGGEQQRVNLARVLAQLHDQQEHPTYLLLDEPTSSLDIAQQHGLLDIVRQRCVERGYGVAAVVHDLNLAAQYADYFLFMKNGEEVGQGPSQLMLRKEMIEHTFSYPVELIYGENSDIPMIYTKGSTPFENTSLLNETINSR
ncbi:MULTISPECIES: heme ABC transporter ATP-binding protein [unclassified Imperialibacter]|uniref:heme ABC transporter ATP-binding protein n=1 Tax=unclassified Imperialibacter TaxID=2629706 RepID=UPI0012555318|nr:MULTISPECIES: heme ABC transporter ATP-binding protein [unclassified Imperialibacter]CAD5250435.1 Hemin import ATP-binding protein HmuV [Imperialibacter sp. 75]CAD5286960.1 Hemin import ATP-binding protein HmuV [Imperialibacter sp. 89]VVT05925.1 Hemin import ATP-binding protein HmuV [Imperialibacter sp. EC-SDR9]